MYVHMIATCMLHVIISKRIFICLQLDPTRSDYMGKGWELPARKLDRFGIIKSAIEAICYYFSKYIICDLTWLI